MRRLIDADSLMKMIEKYQFGAIRNEYEREIVKENIIGFINSEPTAYDINKVVEHLEEMKKKSILFENEAIHQKSMVNESYFNGKRNAYAEAIEIVKAGGRE